MIIYLSFLSFKFLEKNVEQIYLYITLVIILIVSIVVSFLMRKFFVKASLFFIGACNKTIIQYSALLLVHLSKHFYSLISQTIQVFYIYLMVFLTFSLLFLCSYMEALLLSERIKLLYIHQQQQAVILLLEHLVLHQEVFQANINSMNSLSLKKFRKFPLVFTFICYLLYCLLLLVRFTKKCIFNKYLESFKNNKTLGKEHKDRV